MLLPTLQKLFHYNYGRREDTDKYKEVTEKSSQCVATWRRIILLDDEKKKKTNLVIKK